MENTPLDNQQSIDRMPIDDTELDRQVRENYDISLLEEKLVVKRQKHKLGEVVVRKEVETQVIHIPIRREKLIVEKVGVTTEHLTEVNLAEEQVNGVKFGELDNTNDIYQTQSNFVSLQQLKDLLTQIPDRSNTENVKLRLEIITDNSQSQRVYQNICDS